ncbi:unnamed protein product [Durusdinium trenchii]|uniref:TMEM205-like domain-containing protein n=1 Tax=Durusdinium trenchii TaxID=1381693 RepID=A0ABP0MTD0_9DINO
MCNPIRCKGLRCSFTFYQLSHGANVNIFIYFVLAGLFKSKFCELWQILKPCVPEAACFPEYFALQSGSCILALGGAPSSWAKLLMTIATMLALVNQLVLGPRTAQLMVKLYDTSTGSADQPLLDGSSDVKKTFGMVHGISMLLDLLNLFAVFAYLCMVAG